jgi:hypothetical protein
MSVAKRIRRKMVNGYAHMSGDLRRPRRKLGAARRSIQEAIAAEAQKARRMAAASKKK